MANQEKSLPEYRKHDYRSIAVVTIDGVDFDLGQYGTAASRNRYDRLVTEWIANGRALSVAGGNGILGGCLPNCFCDQYPTGGLGML